ncbi:MAG: hypothetical protein KKA05_03400 [Alphaproteobacteria bacterium]|nr:hypothetical protein [Alphaproteobacteria bacterium]MBU0860210.1 hypothetical protein [Alphaproteobacteria bacterium]
MSKAAQLQTYTGNNAILTVLGGERITVENFDVEDIWVVDEDTYADLQRDMRMALEPDHFRSNTPYYNPDRARAVMGEKLIVARDGSKGFVLCVSEKVRTASAEGFFRSARVIPGEKLFGRYDTPQILKDRFGARAATEGFDAGTVEPTFALYVSYPRSFSAEKVTPEIARRAIERRNAANVGPVPVLGL